MSNDNPTDISYADITTPEGVSHTTVSITLSTKALGVDAFIKVEESFAFGNPVDAATAILKRDDMLDILREQAIEQALTTGDAVREAVARAPRGNVSITPVQQAPVSQGTQAGRFAPAASGPAATLAVANGAAPAPAAGGMQWMSVSSRFGDGEIRFLSSASYSTEQMEADVATWLVTKGLNPDAFKVWDNRTGPKGMEAGNPNGCVANIKLSKEAQAFVPQDVANQAIGRVKFNSNGTLYVWFTKEAEAALKYGALDGVKLVDGE